MNIETSNPQAYFAAFYILSVIVASIAAAFFARKHDYSISSVLLVLAGTTLLTITGSRFFTVPASEWMSILIYPAAGIQAGRSAIGGIIFGLTCFLISVKILGLGNKALQVYAWTTPLALGIQKIGCFFNGCCFGVRTDSIFGITYPKGTAAHFSQVLNGTILPDSPDSYKIIPVQLLETGAYLLIAYLAWRSVKLWKKKESTILFSFLLLFASRFFTEFIRDPISSPFRNIFWGIRTFQWFLLLSAITCAVIILFLERHARYKESRVWPEFTVSLNRSLAYLSSLCILLFVLRELFTFYEKVSIYLILIPVIILIAYRFYQGFPSRQTFVIKSALIAFPLFMIYPTFTSDSSTVKKIRPAYYDITIKRYRKADAGFIAGKYYSSVYYDPHQGECGTQYSSQDYEHLFTIIGGGYSVVTNHEKYILAIGMNGFAGKNTERNLTTGESKPFFIGGIDPYLKYDRKWIGTGVGLNIGDLRWVIQKRSGTGRPEHGTKFFPFLPQFELRLGRKDILDVRYSYGMNSFATFPIATNELSFGTGLGIRTDCSLRLGVALSDLNQNTFISGELPLSKNFGMNFKYHFRTYSNYNPDPINSIYPQSKGVLIFGASYRFGFEK